MLSGNDIINSIYSGNENNEVEQCLVCYGNLDDNYTQILCGHKFHNDCIIEAYKMRTSKVRECPYCRKDGGYIKLNEGEKPIKFIHKEYISPLKKLQKKIPKKKAKTILLKKSSKKNTDILIDETKCHAILKTGVNKGKQCSNNFLLNNGCFCGVHKKIIN